MIHIALWSLYAFIVTGILYLIFGPSPLPNWRDMDPLLRWWFGGLPVVYVIAMIWEDHNQRKFWKHMFGYYPGERDD